MNEQLSMFEKDLTSPTDSGTVLNERTNDKATGKDGKSRETMRSMIHPQYANRFIRRYIL